MGKSKFWAAALRGSSFPHRLPAFGSASSLESAAMHFAQTGTKKGERLMTPKEKAARSGAAEPAEAALQRRRLFALV